MADTEIDNLSFNDIPDPAARRAAALSVAPVASVASVAPEERSPTRAERKRFRTVALLVTALWLVVAVLGLGVREDIGDAGVLMKLTLWAALLMSTLLVLLRPGARGLPAGAWAVRLSLGAVPLVYVISTLMMPHSTAVMSAAPHGTHVGCILISMAIAAIPLALAGIFLRRTFLSMPGARGAAVGAGCGLLGAIGIHLHCPLETTTHLLFGHGLAIVVCVMLGGALGAAHGRA